MPHEDIYVESEGGVERGASHHPRRNETLQSVYETEISGARVVGVCFVRSVFV